MKDSNVVGASASERRDSALTAAAATRLARLGAYVAVGRLFFVQAAARLDVA